LYSDVAAMLETERPDVLHITTPPQSHLSLTRQAVGAGCHIFLEKPVALHHSDAEAIIEAATGAGRKLAVNYWPRFEAPALELRRLYETGVLGLPIHVESFLGYDLGGEYGTALKRDPDHWVNRLPGKLFQNVLDHVLNKITPFLDDELPIIEAMAYRGNATGSESSAGGLLDELRVVMRGAQTSAYATFSAHARPLGRLCAFMVQKTPPLSTSWHARLFSKENRHSLLRSVACSLRSWLRRIICARE